MENCKYHVYVGYLTGHSAVFKTLLDGFLSSEKRDALKIKIGVTGEGTTGGPPIFFEGTKIADMDVWLLYVFKG